MTEVRTATRRHRRWALVAAIAAALLALVALRNVLIAPWLLGRLSERLRRDHGLELEASGVSGNWITSLSIDELGVRSLDARSAWNVRASDVELEYDLGELLRTAGEGLRSVRAGGVVGRASFGVAPRADEFDSVALRRQLAWLPTQIAVERLELDLEFPEHRTASLRSGELALRDGTVEARVERIALGGPWPTTAREFSLDARGQLTGETFMFERLRVGGALELELEHGELRATTSGLRAAFHGRLASARLDLVAETAERAWMLDWKLAGANLEHHSAALVPLRELGLAGHARGAGRILIDEQGVWSEASVQVDDLCVDGIAFDSLDADVLLRPGWIEVPRIAVRQRDNLLWGAALELPLERSSWFEFLQSARGHVELCVHDLAALEASPPGWIGPHRVSLEGELGPRGLAIARGRLETHTGRIVVRTGELRWREPIEERAEIALEGDLYFVDLAELGALVDTRSWAGSARGTLEIAGTLAEPQCRLALRGERVVLSGLELGALEARARVDGARVEILSLSALGALGHLHLQGAMDWRTRVVESSALRVSVPALEVLLPERFARGVVALDARLSGALDELEGEVEIAALDVATSAGHELDRIDASARMSPRRVDVRSLSLGAFGVDLRAKGALVHEHLGGPMLAEIEEALLVRDGVGLVLARPCAVEVERGSVSAPAIAMTGLSGELLAAFAWREGEFELDARFDDIEPIPLLAPFLGRDVSVGDVDGRAHVREESGRFEIAADLQATRIVPGAGWPALALDVSTRASGARAVVERCTLRAGETLALSLMGELPFDERAPWRFAEGALQASVDLRIGDASVLPWRELGLPGPVAGELAASGRLAGVAPDLRGYVEVEGKGLSIAPLSDSGVVQALGVGDGTVRARIEIDGALSIEDFSLAAKPGVRVEARGTLFSRSALDGWWRARRAPWTESGADIAASWAIENLAVLAELTPMLRRTAGTTRGEVRVEGALASPRLTGRAELRDGEVRLDARFPALQRLSGEFRLEGERVQVERLVGELGAGPFEIAGSVRVSPRVEVDLAIKGRELLVVQRPDLRVRADAELALTGPLEALLLRGDLAPQDSRWSRNFDWFRPRSRGGVARDASPPLFSIDSGALSTLRFDVHLRGGEPFRIDSNIARGSLRPDLALTGTGRAPVLTGALFLDPTVVPLPAANLELRAGTLAIDRRDPLDPVLDFALSARVRGYDLAIRASGRYSAPELELSSVPPLPGEDILMLLLTGRAPGGSLSGDEGVDAAETVIVYLGKDLLSRLFEGEGSMMERVEFQTGADVTQNGGSTAQVRIRVSGRAEGTGRAIYLRGERDIYDRINFGARFVMRLR